MLILWLALLIILGILKFQTNNRMKGDSDNLKEFFRYVNKSTDEIVRIRQNEN